MGTLGRSQGVVGSREVWGVLFSFVLFPEEGGARPSSSAPLSGPLPAWTRGSFRDQNPLVPSVTGFSLVSICQWLSFFFVTILIYLVILKHTCRCWGRVPERARAALPPRRETESHMVSRSVCCLYHKLMSWGLGQTSAGSRVNSDHRLLLQHWSHR